MQRDDTSWIQFHFSQLDYCENVYHDSPTHSLTHYSKDKQLIEFVKTSIHSCCYRGESKWPTFIIIIERENAFWVISFLGSKLKWKFCLKWQDIIRVLKKASEDFLSRWTTIKSQYTIFGRRVFSEMSCSNANALFLLYHTGYADVL